MKKNKTNILMNKPVYLRLSVLELSKILMYELWYDFVKTKHVENSKLCYMNTDILIVCIKTHDFIKISQEMLELDLALQIMN